jgi:phage-related protein
MDEPKPPWQVEFFEDNRGQFPVRDYLGELQKADQVKIRDHLRLLREFGTNLGEPHAKAVSGHKPLWELRPSQHRIFYFAVKGRMMILLHAYRKKRFKLLRKEIDIAKKRMGQFLERENG